MNYSITTTSNSDGFALQPHDLRPLGVSGSSKCFGLWVEGRSFDRASQLNGSDWLNRESPHFVVSHLPPDLWPAAFSLRVMVQRPFSGHDGAPRCEDSFLGLTDALDRCGVNLISNSVTQLGYDLTTFDAVCELPRYAPAVAALLSDADQAGLSVESVRLRYPLAKRSAEPNLIKASKVTLQKRTGAFQSLGKLLLFRLSELEAKLLVMDEWRYRYWSAANGGSREVTRAKMVAQIRSNVHMFAMVVGHPPDPSASQDVLERKIRAALAEPWFLSRSIVQVGENPYFMAYQSMPVRSVVEELDVGVEDSEEEEERVRRIFEFAHSTQASRPLSSSLEGMIAQSITRGQFGKRRAQSGTAERIQSLEWLMRLGADIVPIPNTKRVKNKDRDKDKELYLEPIPLDERPKWIQSEAYYSFFHRQVFRPITATPLSTLAFARFWALAGAQGRNKPLQLRFHKGVLGPKPPDSMTRLYGVLNEATGSSKVDVRGNFGPGSHVIASINLQDRFARMRFARDRVERFVYLTVRLRFTLKPRANEHLAAQGLLRELAEILRESGLRIDRCSNVIPSYGQSGHACQLVVLAKAHNRSGIARCEIVESMTERARVSFASTWSQGLRKRMADRSNSAQLRLQLLLFPGIQAFNG